jgi:hypothetical protein
MLDRGYTEIGSYQEWRYGPDLFRFVVTCILDSVRYLRHRYVFACDVVR